MGGDGAGTAASRPLPFALSDGGGAAAGHLEVRCESGGCQTLSLGVPDVLD